jgi:hypothetical protein
MSNHNITQVVERAARAYLLANLPTWLPETQVYRGIENRESEDMEGQESSLKVRPCVTFYCETASPVNPNWAAMWDATLRIEVESRRSDTTGDAHDERAAEVFSWFCVQNLGKALTDAIDGFFCRAVTRNPEGQGMRAEGRGWVSFLVLDIRCSTGTRIT